MNKPKRRFRAIGAGNGGKAMVVLGHLFSGHSKMPFCGEQSLVDVLRGKSEQFQAKPLRIQLTEK
jgi:hypothetical protein